MGTSRIRVVAFLCAPAAAFLALIAFAEGTPTFRAGVIVVGTLVGLALLWIDRRPP